MAREAWEEVSFQVIQDMDGTIRSGWFPTGEGVVNGNVAVDYVWGNVPMQPDDDRDDISTSFGGGSDDKGWSSTTYRDSDTLSSDYLVPVSRAGDHTVYSLVETTHGIASNGYSNFPGYIPNYAGDGDSGLETVVPNFIRKSIVAAEALADAANVQLNTYAHTLTVNYILWTGKTVRISAWDTDFNQWSNTHGDAYLLGLRVGDQVSLSVTGDNFGPFDFSPYKTVTAVNLDGENSWFEFAVDTVESFDEMATGTVFAGPNLENVITTQRSNVAGGEIVDEGRYVNTRYFQY